MSTVFIHGVPDTARVWTRLAARLGRDDGVALALPGFGVPLPAGFEPTKESYLAWLIAQLDSLPGPHDVVAHDWGSILMMRALSVRPDLFRTWVGGGAPFTPDFTWHPTARIWQTPGAGEKAMARLTPDLAIDMLKRAGLGADDAAATAAAIEPTMKACILNLYRSGVDVFETWGGAFGAVDRPGLVIWGEGDVYAAPAFADRIGAVSGGDVVRIPDCGHWWPLERPDAAAEAILTLWQRPSLIGSV